jgi:hypothetical protein
MLVIPVNRVVDPKRIIGKNGGPRSRRGTRGRWPPPPPKKNFLLTTTSVPGFRWASCPWCKFCTIFHPLRPTGTCCPWRWTIDAVNDIFLQFHQIMVQVTISPSTLGHISPTECLIVWVFSKWLFHLALYKRGCFNEQKSRIEKILGEITFKISLIYRYPMLINPLNRTLNV